jgi:hypothetical protein
MTPNVAVPTVVPGLLKFTLLNALKNSARNCHEIRSLTRVVPNVPDRFARKQRRVEELAHLLAMRGAKTR